jgi:hypothetical protein
VHSYIGSPHNGCIGTGFVDANGPGGFGDSTAIFFISGRLVDFSSAKPPSGLALQTLLTDGRGEEDERGEWGDSDGRGAPIG